MSLKTKLQSYIMDQYPNIVSLNDIHQYAQELGYKQATAERKLRPSDSPFIKSVLNNKKHIVGYLYEPTIKTPVVEPQEVTEPVQGALC